MLPTVADGGRGSSVPVDVLVRRVPTVVRDLDEVLFRPGGWFALSAGNQRVPGVVVPSLAAGLELVGQGDVASLVGRLNPGFRVVDVDVEGLVGHAVAEEVAGWCRGRGLWVLVRPSGGADGRTHVFVAVQEQLEPLEAFVAELRGAYGVGRTRIEVREMVRPLSAPHRTGVETRPLGALGPALAALARQTRPGPDSPAAAVGRVRAAGPVAALVPRRRPHTELPAAWRVFLETGRRPDLVEVEGKDYSRSTFEAIATASMVRAGWSVQQAWAAIASAHPLAMDHARRSRDRWIRYVWNRAVEADAASPAPAVRTDPEIDAAVAAARERLRALAWNTPVRQRIALLRVGHTVLDRLHRTGSLRVPVPERDLVLDTGIRDRTTIRTQLRRLNGTVGLLDTTTFHPAAGSRDRSSFEFAIDPAPPPRGGLPKIPPPSCHTPLPQRLPLDLPSTGWLLVRACAAEPDREWEVEELVQACQLGVGIGSGLTVKRDRQVREALAAVAAAGVIRCTSSGRWVFVPDRVDDARARDESWDPLVEQVATERREYRAGQTQKWQVAQAAALKRDRARQHAWWVGLDAGDRRERQMRHAARFARLSVEGQREFKSAAAQRGIADGVSPAAKHQRWIYAMDPDELALVAMERAARFAALPRPLQVAYVQAWEGHRRQFSIPRGTWQIGRPDIAADIEATQHGLQDAGVLDSG